MWCEHSASEHLLWAQLSQVLVRRIHNRCACAWRSFALVKYRQILPGKIRDRWYFAFFFPPSCTCFPPELRHFWISGGKKVRFCVWQLCNGSGEVKNSDSDDGGKEVRVMSNRGENRSGGRATKKQKRKKNIYEATHWASGGEPKELKPCGGMIDRGNYSCLA